MYIYIYIYIYIYSHKAPGAHPRSCRVPPSDPQKIPPVLACRYLSNATCLIRPHLFYACYYLS